MKKKNTIFVLYLLVIVKPQITKLYYVLAFHKFFVLHSSSQPRGREGS